MNKAQFLTLCDKNHACHAGMHWCTEQPGDLKQLFRRMGRERPFWAEWAFIRLLEWPDYGATGLAQMRLSRDLEKLWKAEWESRHPARKGQWPTTPLIGPQHLATRLRTHGLLTEALINAFCED